MRKHLVVAALGLLIVLTSSGCQRKKITPPVDAVKDEGTVLSSSVQVADPQTAFQLLRGFHTLEQNSWRWTMQRFSVALKPPPGSAQKGATLVLHFSIPDTVLQKIGKVTLRASVAGVGLPPATYSKTGDAVYKQAVPAQVLNGETATFDFTLDKALAAGVVDSRELGVVVSRISLDSQ